MYYSLEGKVAYLTQNMAVIECGGVGYKCFITRNTYQKIVDKKQAKLYTHLNVKEDALDLYGFENEQEQQFFLLLISISGVGPRVALSILSELQPADFAAAVMASEYKKLTVAGGVGPKLAQRICLELRDKIAKTAKEAEDLFLGTEVTPTVADNAHSDAEAVLIALGYSKNDAHAALSRCSADNANDLVKQALRLLSRTL